MTDLAILKHIENLHRGYETWPNQKNMPALGDSRWTRDLILATWWQALTGRPPENGLEYRVGASGGGFDRLDFKFRTAATGEPDLHLPLKKLTIPIPFYGSGMSYGSISEQIMLARAKAAQKWKTFTCTGEGGYPDSLVPYKKHVITQVATGYFGVREETIQEAPIVEFKYAQGAKPGLGGHLLGDKATVSVAKMRGSVPWVSLFSPFPFTASTRSKTTRNISTGSRRSIQRR